MTEIDWSALQKEASTAGVLPAASYNLIVVDATATQASTGKPMIKVKFRVMDGPHKDKPVWNQFTLSAENAIALRIFFQHMAAFGLDANFFASNPSMDTVAKNLINRAVTAELGVRQWQGADRNEVKTVSALAAGGPLPPGVVTGPPVASSAAPSPVAPAAASTPPPAAAPSIGAGVPPVPPIPPTQPF